MQYPNFGITLITVAQLASTLGAEVDDDEAGMTLYRACVAYLREKGMDIEYPIVLDDANGGVKFTKEGCLVLLGGEIVGFTVPNSLGLMYCVPKQYVP
jgi:hypothetical protein